jgi:hypothetical protein
MFLARNTYLTVKKPLAYIYIYPFARFQTTELNLTPRVGSAPGGNWGPPRQKPAHTPLNLSSRPRCLNFFKQKDCGVRGETRGKKKTTYFHVMQMRRDVSRLSFISRETW